MRLLFIGDVIAKPGRRAVRALVPTLRRELALDLVIANGENSAGGAGITSNTATELFNAGVDLLTTGNHVWHQREALTLLPATDRIVRPANFPPGVPGHRATLFTVGTTPVLLTNALGRVFMDPMENPFHLLDAVLRDYEEEARVVIVDFHAEATGEKRAMGFYLDGRASLVIGTHTHVPTADAQILPKGTAYVSDAGMVGPRHSVIGVEVDPILQRYLTGVPQRYGTSKDPEVQFNSVLVEVDESTGRAESIERIDRNIHLEATANSHDLR